MTTERRHNARHPVHFEVILRYRHRRFPVALARDLSPGGIYIRTAKLTLPTGTLVELELDRWGRQWLIPAIVTHGDAQGFGLRFRTPQTELYRFETAAMTTSRPPVTGLEVPAISS